MLAAIRAEMPSKTPGSVRHPSRRSSARSGVAPAKPSSHRFLRRSPCFKGFRHYCFFKTGLFDLVIALELRRHVAPSPASRFLGLIWQKAIWARGVGKPMTRLKPEVIECCDAYRR